MIEKTELMKKFEEENPGKHAIWSGKITNQYKNWEKFRSIPKKISEVESKVENEILLFLAISKIKVPTYNKILDFCSSFGIKSNEILEVLLSKIREGEVSYVLPNKSILENIYFDLLDIRDLKIPYTINLSEALEVFKNLNFHKPIEVLNYFDNVKKEFPQFISISSSKLNQPEDLITFKRLFPNNISFKLNNRWAI